MAITNFAKSRIALMIGNSGLVSIGSNVPSYFVIGSGSGTTLITDVTLQNEFDRQSMTSTNVNTLYKITWQGDWNSVELSGTTIYQFGIQPSGVALTGSIFSKTNFPGILFNGTNELRIEEVWEIF